LFHQERAAPGWIDSAAGRIRNRTSFTAGVTKSPSAISLTEEREQGGLCRHGVKSFFFAGFRNTHKIGGRHRIVVVFSTFHSPSHSSRAGMSHHTCVGLFIAIALYIPVILAFAFAPGGVCTGVGSACTWHDGEGTQYNGFCAPNGYCGDNGAGCNTDDDCYDFCGSGICGGLEALCTTQDPFVHIQGWAACDTPNYVCTSTTDGDPGTCPPCVRNVAETGPARSSSIEHCGQRWRKVGNSCIRHS